MKEFECPIRIQIRRDDVYVFSEFDFNYLGVGIIRNSNRTVDLNSTIWCTTFRT